MWAKNREPGDACSGWWLTEGTGDVRRDTVLLEVDGGCLQLPDVAVGATRKLHGCSEHSRFSLTVLLAPSHLYPV